MAMLPHTRAFYPTVDRSWFIDFWNLETKWVFVALPIGFLLMLLFYYDHVSSLSDWDLDILINATESKQRCCASKAVPIEEARWISLGLFSFGMYKFHRWDH